MHLSVFLWLVLLCLGKLAGLGGAVCPQLVSPDVRAWKAQKTVHTGTRLPAVCLSVPWCSWGQEDDLGVGGTDQWAHKPYLGPAVVSTRSPRAFVLTGAMVTVRSSRRNINPAYVHLSLKSPLSRVHKVVAPLGW